MGKKIVSLINKLRGKIKINRTSPILLLPIIILAFLLYFYKGLFIAAMVNGQPIWRITLTRELEKQGGKKTLDSLITKALVLQEAQKQKVVISDEEINQAVKQLEDNLSKQGQNFDQLLSLQGITRNEFKEEIKLQKIVEKIVGKDIKVSDEEISQYFEKNKDSLPKDKKLEDLKDEIKNQLEKDKLSSKVQSWIQSLRESAKINYFVQ